MLRPRRGRVVALVFAQVGDQETERRGAVRGQLARQHGGVRRERRQEVSPLAANRFAEDPLLYTNPNCQVNKGYSNTDGVNNALSANRFAAKRFR